FAIKDQLGLPVIYAGLGEKVEDLQLFDRDSFIAGIFE
ncbi:MAG: signal recognition particle-docking protein FtsY, partial [Chloroflexi bacterium]|nr:signal recognition particle-docking protein FtsY [Chloroflexota bacterium]